VNAAATTAFVLAAVFALGDWYACARQRRRLEYVCKPAVLLLLVVAAIALDPAAGLEARRAWFVAALVFSLAGDVLLMLPRDRFVAGLAAFFVAHVCYIAGFLADAPTAVALVVSAVIVAAVIVPFARVVLRAVRASEPGLAPPVAGYIIVISTMVATALATGNWVAGVGAVLFAGSDSMIAWSRFVRPFAWSSVAIMVTYHLGQAALVVSLLR
jgi:uncharacterized membrane protein YhhN